MSLKSVLTTILLGFLGLEFCHLQTIPINNDTLASVFQDFSKKAVAEMLVHRRYLEEVEETLGSLMGQLKNGTNPMERNKENIRVIARAMQSLGSAVESNERSVAEARRTTNQCGGFIPFEGEQELLYEIPPGIPFVNCIWVLWPKRGGPIRLKNEPNSHAEFDSSFHLIAAQSFSKGGWNQTLLPSGNETMLGVNESPYTFAVIFFKAKVTKLGQGIHLKFEDTGANKFMPFGVPNFKRLSLMKSNGTLKYPSGLSYENNERVFAVGQVRERHSMTIKFDRVNTEAQYDWFRVMWLGSSLNSYHYTGTSTSGTPVIPGGCSYIFLFVSDLSSTGNGIQMSYNITESDFL